MLYIKYILYMYFRSLWFAFIWWWWLSCKNKKKTHVEAHAYQTLSHKNLKKKLQFYVHCHTVYALFLHNIMRVYCLYFVCLCALHIYNLHTYMYWSANICNSNSGCDNRYKNIRGNWIHKHKHNGNHGCPSSRVSKILCVCLCMKSHLSSTKNLQKKGHKHTFL